MRGPWVRMPGALIKYPRVSGKLAALEEDTAVLRVERGPCGGQQQWEPKPNGRAYILAHSSA